MLDKEMIAIWQDVLHAVTRVTDKVGIAETSSFRTWMTDASEVLVFIDLVTDLLHKIGFDEFKFDKHFDDGLQRFCVTLHVNYV